MQPSDDGLSDQDCIELRQSFGQPGNGDAVPANSLFWNDRDCSVSNPFICQKPRNFGSLLYFVLFFFLFFLFVGLYLQERLNFVRTIIGLTSQMFTEAQLC